MIDGCADVVDRPTAVRSIRAVCRYFGGQLLYIPTSKTTGTTTGELYGVLRDSAGEYNGRLMLEKLMALFGGTPVYIPMEKGAFKEAIAREIYDRYDGNNETLRDLCREYSISFTQVYRLYYAGRDEKTQGKFEFSE
jgi:Mor family transcriptional regulator